ncbi:MAG: hypothetical protein GXP55_08810 [Deltaproteobacteria bacterium]|nr:hypothetical protein [Deltaproteobacteria bacterium]
MEPHDVKLRVPGGVNAKVTLRGKVRKLGLEGGLWALATEDGQMVELVAPPAELCSAGLQVEVVGERRCAEVSIGMLGDALRVVSFRVV